MSETPDSIYQLLKRYESQFTPLAPYLVLHVGTLNVDERSFSGLSTQTRTDPEPLPHRPGQLPANPPGRFVGDTWTVAQITVEGRPPHDVWRRTIIIKPAPKVALQPVQLVFAVSRALPQGWSVTANGITATAGANEISLSIDIWDASTAAWTMQANGISHSDSLLIQRPAGVLGGALGAFTIPALPVTIIYAPPADSLKASAASYAEGQTVGCTTDLSSSTDQSHTVPTSVIDTATMATFFGAAASTLGKLAEPDPKTGKAIDPSGTAQLDAGIFSVVAAQIGQLSASATTGITDQSETQFTSTVSTVSAVGTGANAGGPGHGDVLFFLHNLQMAWGYYQGGLRLCPVGGRKAAQPVSVIRNNPAAIGISQQDAASLLALDPFVAGGPAATPPGDRFELIDTWEYGGGATVRLTKSKSRETKTTDTHIDYTVQTNAWDAGPLLKDLGFGTQDQTKVTISNAKGKDVSSTVTIDATLASGPNDQFVVTVWYDRVFGTFAFQSTTPSTAARLTGTGVNPGDIVTLTAGGRTYHTIVDKHGQYAFHAASIPGGQAMLAIGSGSQKPVQIGAPGPLRALPGELRPRERGASELALKRDP